MNKDSVEIVKYRMARAVETLQEAHMLLEAGHNIATVNRLYYACFYAVCALLLTDGFSSPKHTGIRSLFNQHWVKTGRLPLPLGDLYNDLFMYRMKGDYTDFTSFDTAKVKKWLEEYTVLINTISPIIEERISKGNLND